MADGTFTALAERAYPALNVNDIETFLELVHPDVVFGSLIAEAEAPRFVGYEGVRRWWTQIKEGFQGEFEVLGLDDRGEVGVTELRVAATVRGLRVEQRMWQVVLLEDGLARWWHTYRSQEEADESARRLVEGGTGTPERTDRGEPMTESESNEPDQETGETLEPAETEDPSQAEGEASAQEELSQTGEENTGPSGATSPPDATEDATRPPSNPEPDEGKVEDAREQFEQAGGGH